jgi:hypothetical protein
MCVNAIHAGSLKDDPTKSAVTQGMLDREIAKMNKAERGSLIRFALSTSFRISAH